jgi:hypothetical protein
VRVPSAAGRGARDDDALTETGQVTTGETVIVYRVVRSARRQRTIEIRIDPAGGVIVAAPLHTPRNVLHDLVVRRAAWIVGRTAQHALRGRKRTYISGESLPYLGRELPMFIIEGDVRHPHVTFTGEAFRITVPAGLGTLARASAIEQAIICWYREQAQAYFSQRLEHWSRLAGYAPSVVLVRAQKRLWGSCSADGTVRLNWRLLLAAPDLVDYVLVHELAHVRIKNHGPGFWAEVGRLLPDYKQRRAALRQAGASLTL